MRQMQIHDLQNIEQEKEKVYFIQNCWEL